MWLTIFQLSFLGFFLFDPFGLCCFHFYALFLSFPSLTSLFIFLSHGCLIPFWGSWWFRDLGDLLVKECLVNPDTIRTPRFSQI